MPDDKIKKQKTAKWRIFCAFSLGIAFLVIMAWLVILLFSRFHYDRGMVHYRVGDYGTALARFKRSRNILTQNYTAGYLPARLCQRDLFRIRTSLGKTFYQMARQAQISEEIFACLRKGAISLKLALLYDPESYRTLLWAAKTAAAMERIWPAIVNLGGENPYNALPLYEKTINLRPTGVIAHYGLIRYLYWKNELDKIPWLAFHISKNSPSSTAFLRKEPFYSSELKEVIKRGLLDALENNTTPRIALFNLSDMALQDGDINTAVAYYKQALLHQPQLNNTSTRIQEGRLLLKQQNLRGARKPFLTAVRCSKHFVSTLEQIFKIYGKEKQLPAFIRFLRDLEEAMYPSAYIDMVKAACRIEMDQPEAATILLNRINETDPQAKAYDLLAMIAQKQHNWDAMEIASHRATQLDSENSLYWMRFSLALGYQGKHSLSENAVTRAIKTSDKKNNWYYLHRASVRIENLDFDAAIADLKIVLSMGSAGAPAYHLMARAYHGLKQTDRALSHINQSIRLAPENRSYLKFKKVLLP